MRVDCEGAEYEILRWGRDVERAQGIVFTASTSASLMFFDLLDACLLRLEKDTHLKKTNRFGLTLVL